MKRTGRPVRRPVQTTISSDLNSREAANVQAHMRSIHPRSSQLRMLPMGGLALTTLSFAIAGSLVAWFTVPELRDLARARASASSGLHAHAPPAELTERPRTPAHPG